MRFHLSETRQPSRMAPPYELFCVVRHKTNPAALVQTMKDVATIVTKEGGIVSGFQNLGVRPLPKGIKGKIELGKERETHSQARFATLDFVAAPSLLQPLRESLEQNAEMLRFQIHQKKNQDGADRR